MLSEKKEKIIEERERLKCFGCHSTTLSTCTMFEIFFDKKDLECPCGNCLIKSVCKVGCEKIKSVIKKYYNLTL